MLKISLIFQDYFGNACANIRPISSVDEKKNHAEDKQTPPRELPWQKKIITQGGLSFSFRKAT